MTELLRISGIFSPELSKVDHKCIKFYLEIILISKGTQETSTHLRYDDILRPEQHFIKLNTQPF